MVPNDDGRTFNPMLYNFRVSPKTGNEKEFTLQQPFATLFDNLITVLWSVFSKNTNIQIGKIFLFSAKKKKKTRTYQKVIIFFYVFQA